jgi:branched-subunit amino acid transport protein
LSNVYASLAVMALVTYIIRVTPIAMIKGKLNSRFVRSFLFYMPYAVLGAMTFPSILYSSGNILASAIGGIVALILAYYNLGMMRVALGGILAVYLFQTLLL